jgi:hypothetical protein
VNDVTQTATKNLSYLSVLPKSVLRSGKMESDCAEAQLRDRKGCLGSTAMKLETRLEIWIVARCLETNPRPQRVAELNAIFREIYGDCRFWRYRNAGNCAYYEEALSRMWKYFLKNLCEATTARKSGSFLETCDFAVGRLLMNLNGHLKNIQKEIEENRKRREQPRIDEDGTVIDPVDELPDPTPDIAALQFEAFVYLLETDPEGELNAQSHTLRGTTKSQQPYTLTAQTYLLMRHKEDMAIQQIADELDIPRGSLQGGAKPTKWKALERKYSQMAMDSVSVSGGSHDIQ